jgi:mRNA interferase RelE/StbE
VSNRREAKLAGVAQPKKAAAIETAMEEIAANPFGEHPNASYLKGTKSGFRLRQGDLRILYRVDRTVQTVFVERLKPRGEAYKE